jgi:gliding motility-associated-like protein
MKKNILFSITVIVLSLFSNVSFSQTLELGILSSFEAYTGVGAVTNSGTFSGDVGTNTGIISGTGFGIANGYTGVIHNNNATTLQARIDLLRVYMYLDDVFVTKPSTHAPAFGGGETISAGVYSIGGAGSIGGALTLDGGGDSNAYFIIKFEGALTVALGSSITLTNGTRAANVFWISQGAISVGASSDLKGTLFAHPGAVTLGVGSTIEGRLLSSEGAITIAAGGAATMPIGPINIPIKCLGNCSPNPLLDVLGSIKSYALFTSKGAVANAATSGIIGDIGTNLGAISGFLTSTHVGFVNPPSSTASVQAAQDLDYAYNQLINLPNTELGHTPAFGSGETLNTGVYYIGGAGSLAGTITLDGQNKQGAMFVFKFNGAFSVAAQSKVILINGARRCNVFWISEGATDLGTFTYMKGTLLAHGGACTAGANSSVEGRMLSTEGAIGFSTGVIYNDTLCFGSILVNGSDQDGCIDDVQTLTATAITDATSQNIVWYDAPTGGNVVNSPTQEGIGSITYYGEASNGAYTSENRAAVTLTINDCSTLIDAVVDTVGPINGTTGGTTTALTSNDTLNGVPVVITITTGTVMLTGLSVPTGLTLNEDGTVTIDPNTPAGQYDVEYQICEVSNPANCDSVTSTVVVSAPGIDAVIDTVGPINGTTGGTTTSLTTNDTLNGDPVIVGEDLGTVVITGLSVPTGLTLNEDGTVTIDPNTPAGEYDVEYQICEFSNSTNCDSVISTVVVSTPVIDAVIDTVGPINGTTGGTTTALTSNDTLNGDPVVIGTTPGTVILTGLSVPQGLTLNTDGTVTIDPNTPAGEYDVEYQICEVSNPTNCDSVISSLTVTCDQGPAPAKVNCWDTFEYNTDTCAWENTGTPQEAPKAGTDGTLTVCEGTSLTEVVLFDALTGADAGGTWSNIGLEYTYTVRGTGACASETDTSIVTVTQQLAPNAGTDGTLTVCEGTSLTEAALFDALTVADAGGTWSGSIDGVFYTYTVIGTGACASETDTSIVTVTEQDAPNAGLDGSMAICAGTSPSDAQLFATLNGADGGGSWSNIGLEYTYTVTGTGACASETDTSIVTVTDEAAPNAGINGTLAVCVGTSPTDAQLFAQLNGTPDTNGTWSNIDLEYTYTVVITGECASETDTSIVTVIEEEAPNAGTDGSMTLCAGTSLTEEALFGALSGTPDTNGTWSGSVDGIFYTYTVTGTGSCVGTSDTSIVTITEANPTSGSETELCIDDDFDFDLFSLLEGDFQTDGIWSVTLGNATIDGNLFNPFGLEIGVYTFTYTDTNSECSSDTEVTIILNDDCVVLNCGDDIIISKAVTPNGDQWNEYFTIKGIEECGFTAEVKIFNRWGAKIYESINYENTWNGFSRKNSIGTSDKVPTGTYFYMINIIDSGLKPFVGSIYVETK